MNQHHDILLELQQLSPVLAGISRENVYTVPDGYFEMLSSEVMLQVRAGDPNIVTPVMKASIPGGYFEGLAETILARIKTEVENEAVSEITSISPLIAGISKTNVFSVPSGYFNNLAVEITGRVTESVAPVREETVAISAVVASIGNKNVYTVPEGYFMQSADQMRSAVVSQAKVVIMKPRFNLFRYAAAAVITGLVGLSIVSVLNKSNTSAPTTQTAAVLSDAKQIIETRSFEKELSSVSDAAIVSYLESKGQDVEAALVASLVDDKSLPEAEDYILNENTLDEVLKTLDLNN